ncbi:MerR family DNA-binding protein [Cupriavidus sp. YAF13]|uniref:MerR family DNA-binding protein n=1 Tax=Cupriavidus sp. YAF13 TaxID=3233075 RepID=UPI003F902C0A
MRHARAQDAHQRPDHHDGAKQVGFSLAQVARHGTELRNAPDPAHALSALLQEKLELVDVRLAELTALRAEIASRIGAACPFRA